METEKNRPSKQEEHRETVMSSKPCEEYMSGKKNDDFRRLSHMEISEGALVRVLTLLPG